MFGMRSYLKNKLKINRQIVVVFNKGIADTAFKWVLL
jgi:hypothetical protein